MTDFYSVPKVYSAFNGNLQELQEGEYIVVVVVPLPHKEKLIRRWMIRNERLSIRVAGVQKHWAPQQMCFVEASCNNTPDFAQSILYFMY